MVLYLIVWVVLGAGIGAAIGSAKGRTAAGFWLGFFLGWIGWIIAALLSRSPEVEARRNVAIAVAAERLTAGPATPRRTVTPVAPLSGPRTNPATNRVLDGIFAAAAADRESAVIGSAIERFGTERRPVRPLSDWFFASEGYPFVARYDGLLYACSARTVFNLDKSRAADYTVDDAGNLVRATIGGVSFSALRPTDRALRLLESLRATRHVDDTPPPVLEVPGDRSGWPAPAPNDALRTLQGLHADGLISDDEYHEKRRAILDRL